MLSSVSSAILKSFKKMMAPRNQTELLAGNEWNILLGFFVFVWIVRFDRCQKELNDGACQRYNSLLLRLATPNIFMACKVNILGYKKYCCHIIHVYSILLHWYVEFKLHTKGINTIQDLIETRTIEGVPFISIFSLQSVEFFAFINTQLL